ncbi:hypothetical protein DPMN_040809 [Dreissena polymorpha]|uniref:Uncharacterized protein n=1 Tax=Dreissena polymorpha TaxID=45954 RepID=A0A9D4CWQ6_DREPO|nr:hypothetical protein DPMN_040809 [Dreissena polymorpha]
MRNFIVYLNRRRGWRAGTREDEAVNGARDVLDQVKDQARAFRIHLSQLTTGKVLNAVSRQEERAIKNAFAWLNFVRTFIGRKVYYVMYFIHI